jgi:RHS repeat-associated protein
VLFAGRELLPGLGIYDSRHRLYSPSAGRFLQTDPIRFAAGDSNIYRYCGNDPVNWVDPWGMQARSPMRSPRRTPIRTEPGKSEPYEDLDPRNAQHGLANACPELAGLLEMLHDLQDAIFPPRPRYMPKPGYHDEHGFPDIPKKAGEYRRANFFRNEYPNLR